MKHIFYISLFTLILSCSRPEKKLDEQSYDFQKYTSVQDSIIKTTFSKLIEKKLDKYDPEVQTIFDEGLLTDSTISYLWQQKAMLLYKQGKYELGLPFLDKAVKYNRREYLSYRAFMKCIFAKDYNGAIKDFELCIKEQGNLYEMDHSYQFYIALSFLQLNKFEKAENIFREDINTLIKTKGINWVHHLDLFYYGISLFEQKKYAEAIIQFDIALEKYPEFSDVQYYKAKALKKSGNEDIAEKLIENAEKNAKLGYTINDDNTIYERYPYQVRW
ncbi:MAG: tetratricopeptide repeat protein [Chitinophagales bacterium]